MSPDEIARRFREALNRGEFLEPSTYYAVERDCLAALQQANSAARVSLFCAAALAEKLARALKSGGIEAHAEASWRATPTRLIKSSGWLVTI